MYVETVLWFMKSQFSVFLGVPKDILNPSNINNAKLICRFLKEANAICKYYTLLFYFPYLSLLAQPVNILIYYTLHFYFPYLSLLAQAIWPEVPWTICYIILNTCKSVSYMFFLLYI
jgi:hypothetical protein